MHVIPNLLSFQLARPAAYIDRDLHVGSLKVQVYNSAVLMLQKTDSHTIAPNARTPLSPSPLSIPNF
jgi:hypothetical protein